MQSLAEKIRYFCSQPLPILNEPEGVLLGLAEYFIYYNGERSYQALVHKTPRLSDRRRWWGKNHKLF
jgi:hypothetical protein